MRRIVLLVVVVVLGAVGHPNTVDAAWQITQLTDNGSPTASDSEGSPAWPNGALRAG